MARLWLALIMSAVFASACAAPRAQLMSSIPSARPAKRADLRVLTFNAGLAPGLVRYASQRLPLAAKEVAAQDADVVCLQEVWTDAARDAAIAALGLPPANVFYTDTGGQNETGADYCAPGELDGMLSCVRSKCADEAPEDLTLCASNECVEEGTILYLRSRSCLNCVVASVGRSASEIVRACGRPPGASRVYGGNNGVLLASRWPLLDKEVLPLPASGANRVALIAGVEVPGKGRVEVACTHISAKARVSPTNPEFGDWTEEQLTQMRLIAEKLSGRGPDRPHLLVGDLNFSQRNDAVGVSALMWSTWRLAADLGFVSPGEYAEPPFCSWCSTNRLVGHGEDHLIDHVLVRNPPSSPSPFSALTRYSVSPVCAYPVFREPVPLNDRRGRSVITALSDHYGIIVELDLH